MATARHTADGSFITRDGLNLSTWRIHVPNSKSIPVIIINGLSDHSRSMPYLRLGEALAGQGFEVFAFDRRGSGQSSGRPNFARSWDDLREDLSRFVD
ncbi:MAG: alpha/beta fold hydrolase, partial [Verrucomicrobiales bacterium]